MRERRSAQRSLWVTCGLVVALVAGGCTSDSSAPVDGASGQTVATGAPRKLDVLVYNIEYGGDASTDKVIRSMDADVVGVLESYNRLPQIAKRTGYPYYNVGLQLLSKYPIQEPSGAEGLYALIEVQPGYAVAFFNTHLDYVAYGPRLLASGRSVPDVMASEETVRAATLRPQLPRMAALAAAGFPVILTGDFNEPSSLDYTGGTVGSHDGVNEAVPWPVSESLFDIGFVDTFRQSHPDPVIDPGITYAAGKASTGDRIDYVYAGGPVRTLDSKLIGETGGAHVDVGFDTWTSDHRAVMSTLALEPVALPTTVSLDRRMLTKGEKLKAYYNAPGSAPSRIAVFPRDGLATTALETRSVSDDYGTIMFDTDRLDPSGYNLVMLDDKGAEIARNEFWVRASDAEVQIRTDRSSYRVGEPIVVRWDDGPANRWDWIGVYRASAADPAKDDYLLWGYTGGHDSGALPPSVSGMLTLNGSAQGKPWPLPPGNYVVHYLLTDQYASAGRVRFTVAT